MTVAVNSLSLTAANESRSKAVRSELVRTIYLLSTFNCNLLDDNEVYISMMMHIQASPVHPSICRYVYRISVYRIPDLSYTVTVKYVAGMSFGLRGTSVYIWKE